MATLLDRRHTNIVLFAADQTETTKVADTANIPQEIVDAVEGTLYYKQIAAYGDWVNPMFPIEKMTLDKAWATQIVDNFNVTPKLVDKVPIPRNHTDDVNANTGEVLGLVAEADGLYAYLDIRDYETSCDIDGGLIFDDSISFDWNFVDTKTGSEHGPVLLHVALVNNPYLTGMKPFEKIAEDEDDPWYSTIELMSKDLAPNRNASVIMLSATKAKEINQMGKTATIKNDRDFAVEITVKDEEGVDVQHTLKPGEEVPVPEDQSEAVLTQVKDAVKPEDEDTETADEKAEREKKEAEEAEKNKGPVDETEKEELSRLRAERVTTQVNGAYTELLSKGKITPAQKDKFMELSKLSNGSVQLSGKPVDVVTLLSGILDAGPKIVSLNKEDGTHGTETDEQKADRQKREAEEAKANEKPSAKLSDADRRGLEATGTSVEEMDALAEKHPEMRKQLEEIDTKRANREK